MNIDPKNNGLMGVRFIVISFNPAIRLVTQPPNGSSAVCASLKLLSSAS
jgi:hypothetical protein